MRPNAITAAIAAYLGLVGLGLALPDQAMADTLVDNVNGISVERDGTVTRFAGMVIDDHGRITQILTRRDKPPERIDYREDGKGRTIIPGFVDSHVRLMELGLAELSLDLSGATSLAEAQGRIAAYAAAFPDRPWIVGRGWDSAKWGWQRLPTSAELNAAVADRPVWLVSADGDAGWANSAALKASGISLATRDPVGGRIIRQGAGNAPAGTLTGTAMDSVAQHIPAPRAEDREIALARAQDRLLAHGVTAVAAMGTTIEDWMSLRRMADAGRLQLRVMAYADKVETMLLVGGSAPTLWLYDDRLRLNGLYLQLDGTLASHGALLHTPYADDPDRAGLARLNGTQLRNLISRAAMDNFQLAFGASGDAAVSEALASIEELSQDFPGDRRWRIEHAELVSADELPRLTSLGVTVSMQPAKVASDWRLIDKRLGPEALAAVHAWNALRSSGVQLAFGSGAPALAPNPLTGIATAISREDGNGEPFGGWQPAQRVTREQALAAYTAGAAYAGFAEGRFGSLKVGERADFVVLAEDPLLANPQDLRAMRVLETWIGGRKVYAAEKGS